LLALGLVAALSGCAAAREGSVRPTPRPVRTSVAPLLGCLRSTGADAGDVSARRDLAVSGGEVAVSFSTFTAYVGLADGRREARAAARGLDRDLMLLTQPGHAKLYAAGVYYFDAGLVPRAADGLVRACLDGSRRHALVAMAALARELPVVELPRPLERAFLARCGLHGSTASCGCAYGRAARLFGYGQVARIAANRPAPRTAAILAGLLRLCAAGAARVPPA
jgi:hypothetical protein